jgi:hypothetical protein
LRAGGYRPPPATTEPSPDAGESAEGEAPAVHNEVLDDFVAALAKVCDALGG